jgi:hypothetical protein
MKDDLVGYEIRKKISELGKLWLNSEKNPKTANDLIDHWEGIVIQWKNDHTLPLIVRKQSDIRGSESIHRTGRKIIITDNSFSQWIYFNILKRNKINYNDIKTLLVTDQIPFSFAIKREEKEKVKYKKCLGSNSINKLGWKLCHIDSVGLNSSGKIIDMEIGTIEAHFMKLANPRNMFLVPLEIGELGEIQEFIDEQK